MGPFPTAPESTSLPPATLQGRPEEPVPGPGQAAPRVPGRGRPGGRLPAGPAEEPHGEEGLCQQPRRSQEESPVLPDQAADGEREPVPVASSATLPALLRDGLPTGVPSNLLSKPGGVGARQVPPVLHRGGR